MALPSQTSSGAPGGRGRIGGGRRRRGGRRRLAIVAVGLLAVGAGGLWLLRSKPSAAKAQGDTLAINDRTLSDQPSNQPHELRQAAAAAERDRAADRPREEPVQPAPVELTQRRGSPALPEADGSRLEEDQAALPPVPPAQTPTQAPAARQAPAVERPGRTGGAAV